MSKYCLGTLRETETCEALLDIKESRWYKLFPPPKANQQQHVVVMRVQGDQADLYATLTESNLDISLGKRLLNRFVYLIVDMKQKEIQVLTEYDFKDIQRHRVDITANLEYQVVDAKTLITDGRDAIKELRRSVENTIQDHLDSLGPGRVDLAGLKESIEEQLREMLGVKQELGIEVKQVSVGMELSQERAESYQEKQDRIRNVTQLLDAVQVSGMSLKTVIERVDPRLMLNFFTLEWEDAMGKLQARLDDIIDGRDYERRIKLLKTIETDEVHVEKVRGSVADIVRASLSTAPEMHAISIPAAQVESSSQPQSPPTNGTMELKAEHFGQQFGIYHERWNEILDATELLEETKISGVSLRTIIEKLDFRLMLNFYYLDWDEAMEKLQARLDDIVEGKDYERKIELLRVINTDEMHVEEVREGIADIVHASLANAPGMHNISTLVPRTQSPS